MLIDTSVKFVFLLFVEEDLTVEIKLRFQISLAWCGLGMNANEI